MNYKRNLVTGLIGLALLATPIAAAAKDNDSGRNTPQHMARSNEPVRSGDRVEVREQHNVRTENHVAAPANVVRQESRDRDRHEARDADDRPPVVVSRPVVVGHPDVRLDRDHDDWNRARSYNYRSYGDRDDYRPLAGGYYMMPRGYAGGACAWARHLRAVYQHDRATGHPAAANDLLTQMHRAERACGVPYGYNGRYRRY